MLALVLGGFCRSRRKVRLSLEFKAAQSRNHLLHLRGMMSAPNHPQQSNPDIQALLATLSQLSGTPLHPIPPTLPATTASQSASGRSLNIPTHSPVAIEKPPPDPRLRPQTTSSARSTPTPPTIDPATITTWPDALRCVTKLAAQNPRFEETIRKVGRPPSLFAPVS